VEPDLTEFPSIISEAWAELGTLAPISSVREISAAVSTNHVYNVRLTNGREVIAKTSSYGSYVHFRQDHQLIAQWNRLLGGTHYSRFLAPILQRQHEVFTYHGDSQWLVFYEKAPFYDFLPKILTEAQIDSLARELAQFHNCSAMAALSMNPTWKTVGSDVAALFDSLGSRTWCAERGYDRATERLLREQCETFLQNAEQLGYHRFTKLPILMDWNIGNFSIGFDGDGFKFYTRWDYDWFRIEPRTLDFYFCARVVRGEGDRTVFTYSPDPLFEDRFGRFLRSYHRQAPLAEQEVLFLKEAYRFFLLNYVVRSGEHFFRHAYCQRLQREVVTQYLPKIDALDFSVLLRHLE
jgi:hypothetical protein